MSEAVQPHANRIMEDQARQFEYLPLGPSETRLVQLQKASDGYESICVSLEHFDIWEAPPYFALCYV